MSIQSLALIITGLLNLYLGYFVFKRSKDKANNYFVVFLLGIAMWAFGMYFFRTLVNPEHILFWGRVVYVGAAVASFSFLVFSLAFPNRKNLPILYKILLIFFSLFFLFILGAITFSNFIIAHAETRSGINVLIYNQGNIFYGWFVLFSYVASFFVLLRKYKLNKGKDRLQLNYIIIGTIIGLFLGIYLNFYLTLIGDFRFNWVGPCSSLVLVSATVYAIIRHRLMGIKVLLSKVFVILIIGLTGYGLFHILIYVAENVLGGVYSSASLVLGLLLSVISARLVFPFLSYIQKSSDYIFFRGGNPSKLIKELTLKISGVIDLEKLVEILNKDFKRLIGTENFAVVYIERISRQKKGKISLVVARGGKVKKVEIDKDNALYSRILKEKKLIVKDEIVNDKKNKKILREMKKNNAYIAAPLEAQKEIVGVILIGEKATQNAYTKEDIEFIEIISYQVATVIENTRLYKEVKEFNEKLKAEVRIATESLQNANLELKGSNEKLVGAYSKLHKLDRAKSEFLSIASHQLRTPLTSIKGFTSLLIEGTYGPISNQVKEILQKVFLSNERLVRLVEDLLNISRIESGRFVFDVKKNDIPVLLKEVVDSFTIPVRAKKLSLELSLPRVKVQNLYFDKNKLREVVSNLIDNAVKYSEEGTISVKLENKKDRVRVSVKDSGMGIPEGELDYIFDKFQRGKDINNVHTEGVGLGLYVCKKVVEAHRGAIWAESAGPGKGSTFIFELIKGLKADDMAKKVE